jgi:hypothetical protein
MLSLGSSNAITKSLPAKPASQSPVSPPAKAMQARQPSPREEGPYIARTMPRRAPPLLNRGETLITLSCVQARRRLPLHLLLWPGMPYLAATPSATAPTLPPTSRNLAFRGAVARLPLCSISLVACSLKLPHHSLALLCPEFRARIRVPWKLLQLARMQIMCTVTQCAALPPLPF